MNTRLGKSLGLAFVVAVGILALMFALGTFNSQQASAAPVAPEEGAADTVRITPDNPKPGATGQYTVHFANTGAIGTFDVLEIELEGFDIPDSIDRRDVQIRIYQTVVGTDDRELASGDANAGLPFDVTVDGNVISLEIADDEDSNSIAIPTGTTYPDIIFRKRAGISAPAVAGTYDVTVRLGDDEVVATDAVTVEASISVDPTKGGSQENVTVTGKAFADGTGSLYTQELVNPDANDDGVPDALIVGTAIPTNTVYGGWGIDVDGDDEADYHILRTGTAGAAVAADTYVAVAAEVPPIEENILANRKSLGYAILGMPFEDDQATPNVVADDPSLPPTTYTEAKFLTDATADNGEFTATVAAEDLDVGENGWSQLRFVDANGDTGRTRFQVTGTVTLGDDSVGKGKILKISLSGWITDVPNVVKIGGEEVAITSEGGTLVTASDPVVTTEGTKTTSAVSYVSLDTSDNSATFYVKVTGDDIRLGNKTVVLFYRVTEEDTLTDDEGVDDTTEIIDTRLNSDTVEITAVGLDVSPSSAVAGQVITVEGSGFTDPGTLTEIKVGSKEQTTLSNRRPVGSTDVLSGGRIVVSFKVPAGVTDGSQTIRITDDGDRIGEGTLVVPEPAITLDPDTSRRGTTVNVSGTGFPADSNIIVDYGPDEKGIASGRTDGTGNFTASFEIPSSADIGGDVMVKASFTSDADSGAVEYKHEESHSVPDKEISVTPEMARSGDIVVIVGTGFPRFSDVEWKIGAGDENFRATTTRTDDIGDFTMSITMPGIDPGTHVLQVRAGTESPGTWVLNVPEAPVITTRPSADVFEPLATAGVLTVVWHFDNDTKAWSFYDPRPEVAAAVDLTEVTSGDNVWIQVTADMDFQGESLTTGWNNITLD